MAARIAEGCWGSQRFWYTEKRRSPGSPFRSLCLVGHLLQVLVDLEEHDQQFTPDTDTDQAEDQNAQPLQHCTREDTAQATQNRTEQPQPVHEGDDLWRQHRIEKKDVSHWEFPCK